VESTRCQAWESARQYDDMTALEAAPTAKRFSPNVFMASSAPYGGRFGAAHATDVPLTFHNVNHQFTGKSAEMMTLADELGGAWVAFARTGNPNHTALPDWPAYKLDKRQTMLFDKHSRVENDPWHELRAFWT
jgi:carboxylesterase type B